MSTPTTQPTIAYAEAQKAITLLNDAVTEAINSEVAIGRLAPQQAETIFATIKSNVERAERNLRFEQLAAKVRASAAAACDCPFCRRWTRRIPQ